MLKIINGEMVSVVKWKLILQKDFPFMEQDPDDDNIYKKWGFECSSGWYQLLREFAFLRFSYFPFFLKILTAMWSNMFLRKIVNM